MEQRLRDVALKEEENISNFRRGTAPTLLGLASSLSRFVLLTFFVPQIENIVVIAAFTISKGIFLEPNSATSYSSLSGNEQK